MQSEMTPDRADLRVVSAELSGPKPAVRVGSRPVTHSGRLRLASEWALDMGVVALLPNAHRRGALSVLSVEGAGAATAVIDGRSGGWDAGGPADEGVEGAVGQQAV